VDSSAIINKIYNDDFKCYVKSFRQKSLPIQLPNDYKEFSQELNEGKKFNITKDHVIKYLLKNNKREYNPNKYKYTNEYFVLCNKEYVMLIYSRLNTNPSLNEGLDLFESYLITYDYYGNILSSIVLTQDSDKRFMSSIIDKEMIIESKSIIVKNNAIKWPKTVNAEITKVRYKVDDKGIITKVFTKKIKDIKVDMEKDTLEDLVNKN
jgi:hypothetical protein